MKKIIIFSEFMDISTSKIMRWIKYFGGTSVRINCDDKALSVIALSANCIKLSTSFGVIVINNTDFVWFRRCNVKRYSLIHEKASNLDLFDLEEKNYIFETILNWVIDHCSFLCNPYYFEVNKPHVLTMAERLGIQTPEWLVSDSKQEMVKFSQKHKIIAIKPFEAIFCCLEDERMYVTYTKSFTKEDILKLPDPPRSLFIQKYIEKKYELRVFFFENDFFPAMICSQKDEQTKIDFRKYNNSKPNRIFPCKIPRMYQTRLSSLAKELHLDSGSFDILVDENDNYFFLEVNPIGQFGMISYPCNYNIEKYIAQKLLKYA